MKFPSDRIFFLQVPQSESNSMDPLFSHNSLRLCVLLQYFTVNVFNKIKSLIYAPVASCSKRYIL